MSALTVVNGTSKMTLSPFASDYTVVCSKTLRQTTEIIGVESKPQNTITGLSE